MSPATRQFRVYGCRNESGMVQQKGFSKKGTENVVSATLAPDAFPHKPDAGRHDVDTPMMPEIWALLFQLDGKIPNIALMHKAATASDAVGPCRVPPPRHARGFGASSSTIVRGPDRVVRAVRSDSRGWSSNG